MEFDGFCVSPIKQRDLVFFFGRQLLEGDSQNLRLAENDNFGVKFRPLCPIHVVTFTLISILATDYIQKRRGQALLFSFEYNLSPNLITK